MTAWAIDGEIYSCTLNENLDAILSWEMGRLTSKRPVRRCVVVAFDDSGEDAAIKLRRGTFAQLLAKLDPFQRVGA